LDKAGLDFYPGPFLRYSKSAHFFVANLNITASCFKVSIAPQFSAQILSLNL